MYHFRVVSKLKFISITNVLLYLNRKLCRILFIINQIEKFKVSLIKKKKKRNSFYIEFFILRIEACIFT